MFADTNNLINRLIKISFYSQEMKERARQLSPDIVQIDLDVNRTYRDHIMFRKRYDVKYDSSHYFCNTVTQNHVQ